MRRDRSQLKAAGIPALVLRLAVAGGILGVAALGAAMLRSSGSTDNGIASAQPPDASATTTPPGDGGGRPPDPLPGPSSESVLAVGSQVDFRTCMVITGWSEPSVAAVRAKAESAPRFLDHSGQIYPASFAIHLARFYFITYPMAGSAMIEPGTFSGINHDVPGVTQRRELCALPQFGVEEQWLWLEEFAVVEMRRDDRRLVIRVAEAPGEFHVVAYRAWGIGTEKGAPAPVPYDRIEVVDESNRLLHAEWTKTKNRWELTPDGDLIWALIGGAGGASFRASASVTLGVYGATVPGEFVVATISSGGATVSGPGMWPGPWQPGASVSLQPGDYDMWLPSAASSFLVVPSGTELPY